MVSHDDASQPKPTAPAFGGDLNVALVHDWLDTWAGGENVLEEVAALFPAAPIFTLVDFFPAECRRRLGPREIRPSFVQRMPFARRAFRRYLPLFPRAIESLDVSAFDVVISTSHAVAKGVRTRPRQLHICYCFSPMRYAWDLREQYLGQVGLNSGVRGSLARSMLDRLAAWDARTSSRVTEFVAISRHIADRIARCYGREAHVIYPPVTLPPPAGEAQPRDGSYITVSRLVPYKRIDAIAAAFRRMPDRKLIVVGEGPERARIEEASGSNVHMTGQLGDAERNRLLRRARAFVFAAEEDFGIAPVEAQAVGTPVIGYRRGALSETVTDLDGEAPTGVLFDAQTPDAIANAVRRFEASAERILADACIRSAQRFSTERFRREFSGYIAQRWDAFRRAPATP
jgi:glycosyltransferase involved in cell wall biosynthesis